MVTVSFPKLVIVKTPALKYYQQKKDIFANVVPIGSLIVCDKSIEDVLHVLVIGLDINYIIKNTFHLGTNIFLVNITYNFLEALIKAVLVMKVIFFLQFL